MTVETLASTRYGPVELPTGGFRFRLWAPGAHEVALKLFHRDEPSVIRMHRSASGWFEADVGHAAYGDRYIFRVNDELDVPDPASRYQPDDVHGPSQLIDPAFAWTDGKWQGRPWEETVLYELHIGTFTPEGTFQAAKEKLDTLVNLGVTAVELMPVSEFPGSRNWGYDGVLPFAPDSAYGRPEDLKDFIDTAHRKGLMVFLDVVCNHFGPEGNYLYVYARDFFTDRHHTPWGDAIDFSLPEVRRFFIENILYWLNEYRIDGIRLDAVHAIFDDSARHFLTELAETVRQTVDRKRRVHLVLENDDNIATWLRRNDRKEPTLYEAQWNDDVHHVFHVLLTGESGGYYVDYADGASHDHPLKHLGKALAEGFVYQGEPSRFREGTRRGQPSQHLPPSAFVSFLQNHDQIGNRAFGERLSLLADPHALKAMTALWLLSPQIPLIFMGEEWGSKTPFYFFCDLGAELAPQVTEGRRQEFARFPEFSDPHLRERIPDPVDTKTYRDSHLNWAEREEPEHTEWLAFYKSLLAVRRREIVPRLPEISGGRSGFRVFEQQALHVMWQVNRKSERLSVLANLSPDAMPVPLPASPDRTLYAFPEDGVQALRENRLPAWSCFWFLEMYP